MGIMLELGALAARTGTAVAESAGSRLATVEGETNAARLAEQQQLAQRSTSEVGTDELGAGSKSALADKAAFSRGLYASREDISKWVDFSKTSSMREADALDEVRVSSSNASGGFGRSLYSFGGRADSGSVSSMSSMREAEGSGFDGSMSKAFSRDDRVGTKSVSDLYAASRFSFRDDFGELPSKVSRTGEDRKFQFGQNMTSADISRAFVAKMAEARNGFGNTLERVADTRSETSSVSDTRSETSSVSDTRSETSSVSDTRSETSSVFDDTRSKASSLFDDTSSKTSSVSDHTPEGTTPATNEKVLDPASTEPVSAEPARWSKAWWWKKTKASGPQFMNMAMIGVPMGIQEKQAADQNKTMEQQMKDQQNLQLDMDKQNNLAQSFASMFRF